MDDSVILLSSQSPRIKTSRKLPQKPPTVLALKKQLRRSAAYSNKIASDSIVVVESSTTGEESSSSLRDEVPKTPLFSSPRPCINLQSKHSSLSRRKYAEIRDWVDDVNSRGGGGDTSPSLSVDRSFDDLILDESLTTRLARRADAATSGRNNDINRIIQNDDDFAILDDLYGNKWRENKDQVLSAKKSNSIKIVKNTNDLLRSLHIERTRKNVVESPWMKQLQHIVDSDTDDTDNKSLDNQKYLPVRLDFDKVAFDSNVNKTPRFRGNNHRQKPTTYSLSDNNSINNSSSSPSLSLINDQPLLSNNDKLAGSDGSLKKNKNNAKTKSLKKKHNIVRKDDNLNVKYTSDSSDDDDDNNNMWLTVAKTKSKKRINDNDTGERTYSFLASLSASVPLSQCDISARIFRNNFKSTKDELTAKLFKMFNDDVFGGGLPDTTKLEWNDRLRGTAGQCSCIKTTQRTGVVHRTAKIMLSTKVLDSADRLRDTLIHEMCHAATWIISKVAGGHGPQWKSWTCKAMRVFPELPPISRCHEYQINSKYTYRCINCGYSIARHSKSLNLERKCCGYCRGRFELLINKMGKNGDKKAVAVQPKKPPSGFALFVKENYASIRSPQLKHGDVMKILGQKFGELKV